MEARIYDTDLTDAEWEILRALLRPAKTSGRTGRPRKYSLRSIFNAILYQARTGCQWRLLPKDFPPYNLVWVYFCRWRDDGTLERMRLALNKQVRRQAGKQATPSALVLDSQTVKTTQKGGLAAITQARRSSGAVATSW
jgi:transposase